MALSALSDARAAPADVRLMVDRDLGESLVSAARAFGPADIQVVAGSGPACAAEPAGPARVAVLARQPRPREVEACQRQAGADVLALTIGYQAAALVVPVSAPAFPLRSSDLFRGVARHAGEPRNPAVWRDIDATLPALRVGFLAAPTGSVANRLIAAYVMEPACSRMRGTQAPFDYGSRNAFCGALRADPAISVRAGGSRDIQGWASAAQPGQIAVVTLPELRQLDGIVLPLPLDGVLPTPANVETGRYPAAEKIGLLIVVPRDTVPARRNAVRAAVFELLAESSIGPDGTLMQAGLVPLPPAERIAARSRAVTFVEHP